MYDLSKLKVSSSPHVRATDTTRQIMIDVLIALLPALAMAVFVFGARALVVTLVSVCGSVGFEALYQWLMHKPVTVGDCSAAVTGVLLAYTLPVTAPLWMVLVGDFFAIVIVKQLYGGIGKNFLNPALAGRAFLMASWPTLMTTWSKVRTSLPLFTTPDIVTYATPLTSLKNGVLPAESLTNLSLGMCGGCLGETSALALAVGGIWLLYRRVITLHTPLSFIGTVALLTFLFPRGGIGNGQWMLYELVCGGLILDATFMANDYTTSPVTKWGQVLYGIGCGALTVLIRYFGSYPEGVSYAVLVMNCLTFLLEKITRPRKYGTVKPVKGGASK